MQRLLAPALVVLGVASGCATHPTVDPGSTLSRAPLPVEHALALAPAVDGTGLAASYESNEFARSVRERTRERLELIGLFESIESDPAEASSGDADLVLALRVTGLEASFVGRAGVWWPNTFLWFYAWFPAFFVADETYELRAAVDVEVTAVASDQVVYERALAVTTREDLDDFERGWDFFSQLLLSWNLDEENWAAVATHLGPATAGRLADAIAVDLAENLAPRTREDWFTEAITRSTTQALVVSDRTDEVAAALRDPEGLALLGHAVTAAALDPDELQAGLEALARRTGPEDDVLVVVEGRGRLVDRVDDVAGARIELAVEGDRHRALDEIASALERLEARSVTLFAVVQGKTMVRRSELEAAVGTPDLTAFLAREGRSALVAWSSERHRLDVLQPLRSAKTGEKPTTLDQLLDALIETNREGGALVQASTSDADAALVGP